MSHIKDQFKDEMGFLKDYGNFKTEDEVLAYFRSTKFIDAMKERYGKDKKYPLFFEWIANEDGKDTPYYFLAEPTKHGIPMDFRYYAGLDEITPEVIKAEENQEKRRLLMMEYGIDNFFKDVVEISSHPVYGSIVEATIEGERQRFLKVSDGTVRQEGEYKDYLRSKNMLTEAEAKIYYHPIPPDANDVKKAVAETWEIDVSLLVDEGWDAEA